MPGTSTVAIVGGGCSGTLLAIHLLSAPVVCGGSNRIVMVERGVDVGRGVAYATTCDKHLLNVPAGYMSAYPDDPAHFVRWLDRHQPGADATSFARRRLYGEYLRAVLGEARSRARGEPSLEQVRGQVVDIARGPGHLTLTCAGGRTVEADAVVLAPGNFAPRRPGAVPGPAVTGGRYIDNPWGHEVFSGIPVDATVLLLGSGLTAMDAALSLSDQGHRGPIHLLSRHGLLPEVHRSPGLPRLLSESPQSRVPAPVPASMSLSARGLLRAVRQRAAEAEADGGDWRPAVDGLRAASNQMWAQLPLAEQRRALRHLRSYWNVHRHRMAPEVAAWIDTLRTRGQLHVTAGRLEGCTVEPDGMRVAIRCRPSGATVDRAIGYLVNCTGPESDVTALDDPLLGSLLARGLACPGRLGMGLAVSPAGAVVDRAGQDSGLWAMGSLRQGTDWETMAVPELRGQAAALAARLSPAPVSTARVPAGRVSAGRVSAGRVSAGRVSAGRVSAALREAV